MEWRLFKKNHKNYPGDQYSKEYIDETLALLEEENDLTAIPLAFSFLLTNSKELQIRTAKVLQASISKLSSIQLLRLDKLFRERTSLEWNYDWGKESPYNLLLPTFTEGEKLTILGLCTFHPNGYFREKALDLLAVYSSGGELPFLIIRCNDWVNKVREKAERYVENRIASTYVTHFVDHLPLIFKLNNKERDNDSILFEKIVKLLSEKESLSALEEGIQSEIAQIRFFCYKIIIYSKMFTKKMLVNYLKLEKYPHSRLLLFNEIVADISKEEFNEYYSILKKDKFPMIRVKVLQQLYAFNPSYSKSDIEHVLFDKSSVIRSAARFLLTKQNITDFSSYYVHKITQSPHESLRGTLLGLGETGNESHVKLIIPFLKHRNAGIVKAAVQAIAMLDAEHYNNLFLEMLDHEHKGVSKEARKSLLKSYYKDKKDTIYRLYGNSNNVHTRYNAAVLLCSLPKWDAIPYIIEIYANKRESDMYLLGESRFSRWIVNFNKSFETPTKLQIDSIRQVLNKFGSQLEKIERKELEFCMKGF
ncbi:HEAT repeat domain-containing protein [Metabacillus fastidiosus]|uniref:HEAT repeat domain-containing protein n=1 Tax=Metabacillus fastidiosus TaxID=1458 RepID=UPI003D2D6307